MNRRSETDKRITFPVDVERTSDRPEGTGDVSETGRPFLRLIFRTVTSDEVMFTTELDELRASNF